MADRGEKRSYFLDNAKGGLIFLVVFGHFILPFRDLPLLKLLADFIYVFHMPAFIFISGYLSAFVSNPRKSGLKILIAYVFFNYLMMFFAAHYLGKAPSLLTPYYSYWYLLALLVWRHITPQLAQYPAALPLSLAISLLAGYPQEIHNQFALSRILGFYPFFLAGFMTTKEQFAAFISKRNFLQRLAAVALILLAFIVCAKLSVHELLLNDLIFFPYLTNEKFLVRVQIMLACLAIMAAMAVLMPRKKVRILSSWGRNSLSIYVLHRYVPFLSENFLTNQTTQFNMLIAALALSLVTTLVLGMDKINERLNAALNYVAEAIMQPEKGKLARHGLALFGVVILAYSALYNASVLNRGQQRQDAIHKILSPQQQTAIDDSVEIAFVGDLILLKDQVTEAYCRERDQYDFDPVFAYARKYLDQADFTVGVLEGPVAGSEKGYSTGNYYEGTPLYLNFPDSFAQAIKDGGIDMVTLANNHLLDMGEAGALRTLDFLDSIGLKHVGSYRTEAERQKIKIVHVRGLEIAFLAYTFPSNYYAPKYFFETNKTIAKILVDKNSKYFASARQQVREDFASARKLEPDFVFVVAHMGTQFIHETDDFQKTWNSIFIEEGADVVFGSHSHAVQPIEFHQTFSEGQAKTALIVNCPGNFVNSYIKDNGDATAIAKVFLDPQKKQIVCAGVIPMWTYAQARGTHKALPIFDVFNDPSINLSLNDMRRVEEVHQLVTGVMLGESITTDQLQKQYFLFPEGYYRQPAEPLACLSGNGAVLDGNAALSLLASSSKTVYVGDSVTDGCKNGGYGWFEPIARAWPAADYVVEAHGGATIKTLLKDGSKIAAHQAQVYVIAVGTNDIRYRQPQLCAMTAEEYVASIDLLVAQVLGQNPHASFVFVAPWPSLDMDPFTRVPHQQKAAIYAEFTEALRQYCHDRGHLFADPSAEILAAINLKPGNHYLKDHIHPNATRGIRLYSQKFITSFN